MGLLSSVIFYKLGKRSANKKIKRQIKRDDIMNPDFSDLDPEGEEFAEAQQLYEDFVNGQAEEHMLMEEDKKRKKIKKIEQPKNGPIWQAFINQVERSNDATINLLNKNQENK